LGGGLVDCAHRRLLPIQLLRIDLDLRNRHQRAAAHSAEEAVAPAGVAGDAGLVDQQQDAVVVAVEAELLNPLICSAWY